MELPDPNSQKFKNMIILAIVVMIAGGVFWMYGPKTATGKAALTVMTPAQKAIAERLAALPPGATVEQLNAILGTPMENQDVLVRWKGPVAPEKTRILAQLPDKKLNKLTYKALDLSWRWAIQSDGKQMVIVEKED